MEAIKETIQQLMQAWADERNKSAPDNPELWLKKSLSKKESAHAQARYFHKGILSIAVDSSSWLYYFNLQKEDLLVKLRKISSEVKDIRFSLGEIK